MGRYTQFEGTRSRHDGLGIEKKRLLDQLTIRDITPTSLENIVQLERFEAIEKEIEHKRSKKIGRRALS